MGEPGITEPEWHALYTELERPLFNLAYRYTWNAQDAQDMVHDAFLQLWARRGRIRADTANRYVWTSVLNLAKKRRRWRRTKSFLYGEQSLRDLPASGSPDSEIADSQEFGLLYRAIERLPEKLRAALLLTEFGDMPQSAIAELLSVPIGTVASRRHLALKQLQAQLGRRLT